MENSDFAEVAVDSITKLMHPNAVSTSKINGVKIESSRIESVFAFIAFYIAFFLFFIYSDFSRH